MSSFSITLSTAIHMLFPAAGPAAGKKVSTCGLIHMPCSLRTLWHPQMPALEPGMAVKTWTWGTNSHLVHPGFVQLSGVALPQDRTIISRTQSIFTAMSHQLNFSISCYLQDRSLEELEKLLGAQAIFRLCQDTLKSSRGGLVLAHIDN